MSLIFINYQITITIIYLLILFILCLYIFFYRRNRKLLTDPAVIAPVILNMLDEAVIILNKANKIEYINEKACLLFNISNNEFYRKNISEIILNQDIKDISIVTETKITTSDHKIIPVSIQVVKLIEKSTDIEGLCLILKQIYEKVEYNTDIQGKLKETGDKNKQLDDIISNLVNEKHQIEQKIMDSTRNVKEEHARLYASINNLAFGFIMTDNEKNIIMMNKAAKNLFLIPQSETNIKISDLQICVKGKIQFIESIEESQKNNNTLPFQDIQINDKYTNIFISPIIINRNKILHTIGNVILIEDKTEERLIKRSKNNFFIIASHELRTPLTGIKGYIAIIKQLYFENIRDESLKRIINDIDSSSSRMINIVNDFLSTSKPEQNKIAIHFQQCDLIDIINSSIKETRSIAIEKKLSFSFNNPPFNQAIVSGDKDKIKQIIINLISNSIKYTEHGGITINIEKTTDELFKVFIKDTGKGISEDNIKLLFSKFQKFDPNKPTNIISSGLGLYISKILAEKMHGTIKLEKTIVGGGSTFSISLPAYNDKVENVAIENINHVN